MKSCTVSAGICFLALGFALVLGVFCGSAGAQAPLKGCKGDACDALQTQHTERGIRVRNDSERLIRVVLHACPSGQESFYLKPQARVGSKLMETCGGYEVYYADAAGEMRVESSGKSSEGKH